MQALKEVFYSPYFGVVLSILAYQLGLAVSRKVKHPIANPLLIAVIIIVAVLQIFQIPMEAFQEGGNIINLFLAPATAALAVPINTNLQILKNKLNGIVPIGIAAVIFTGITGSVIAPFMVKLFHITDPIAQGVGIGTCSHAVGTTRAIAMGELQGAMSGIAMGLAGFFTVFWAFLFAVLL